MEIGDVRNRVWNHSRKGLGGGYLKIRVEMEILGWLAGCEGGNSCRDGRGGFWDGMLDGIR